jgi:Tol biopolymer transport system component
LAVISEPNTISILNIKSGESHKLIEQEDNIASLGWSPDGNWIAFDQSYDLYIASVDSGEPILLLRSKNAVFRFWLTVY